MSDSPVILRTWSGIIRTEDRDAYITYVSETGTADYRATPGNLGLQLLLRDLRDGRSEVTTLSWWSSFDAIRAFAGEEIARARYYPQDDRYLLERPQHVDHHWVLDGALDPALGNPA